MQISTPIENCYWVIPDRFVAGEYPGLIRQAPSKTMNVEFLVQAGITSFIDLTTENDGLPSYEPLIDSKRYPNVLVTKFPIKDYSVPDSPDQTTRILNSIDDTVENQGIVYVHCWGGIGRTGTIIGCWLSRHGYNGHSAIQKLQELWSTCPKSENHRSPETDEQIQYILNWKE